MRQGGGGWDQAFVWQSPILLSTEVGTRAKAKTVEVQGSDTKMFVSPKNLRRIHGGAIPLENLITPVANS